MRRRALLTGSGATLLARAPLAAPAIAGDIAATTLRFVPQSNLSALDPVWTTATVTENHALYVFDTLYAPDSALRPKPQMAEGHEQSPDGRIWRIRMREGLRFHDGTPVRAVDGVVSLKRWAVRDPFGQLLDRAVDSWVVPDDRTIEIRLKRPFPHLLDAIGGGRVFIMPERLAATDANVAITEMVGSGPYRFIAAEFNSGSRVVYEKFDGYVPRAEPPDWATGAKVAHFRRVEWHVIPDPATAYGALVAGEVDWWERPYVEMHPLLAKNPDIRRAIADPGGRLAFARLNCLQPPFDDVRVRRAAMRAISQDDTMRAAQGDDTSLWDTCHSLFPRHTDYYTEDNAALMPASLDAGRAALREAGYGGQRVVVINPSDFPDIGPLGQVTAATLEKIGMNVDLQETDWGTVIQRRTNRGPIETGGWSIFHSTNAASAFASPAVSLITRGQGAAGWFGWWASNPVESLAAEWLDTADPAAQRRIALEIGRIAMDEVAAIPLGQFYIKTAFRASLTGILPGPNPYPWNVRRV